jgi:hypothetical protein
MRKEPLNKIAILIVIIFVLTACRLPQIQVVRGSGMIESETREIRPFRNIQFDGVGTLIITQGAASALEIEAESNLLDNLVSDVSGDTLKLGFERQPWYSRLLPTKDITYRLTVQDLETIVINGVGNLKIESFDASSLEITMNGTGKIEIDDLAAEMLAVNINGAGKVEVSGQAQSQSVDINGSGNYDAGELWTETTYVEISGVGSSTVWVTDMLNIGIDGWGSVDYYGSPSVVQDVNGMGDISHLGDK